MEFDDIKAAAERSRRFVHEIDGRRFELITPTQFAVNLISEERRTFARVQRQLVLGALRGWTNVSTDDLRLPDLDLPREPLVYSAEMAEILLNERPDWEDALADVVSARVKERRERLEAASGN